MKKSIVSGLLLVAVLCGGCSAKGSAEARFYAGSAQSENFAASDSAMPESAEGDAAALDSAARYTENADGDPAARRKLVKRANLRLRVADLAAADASINALMEQHGAYAASTETDDNSRGYVIRVPYAKYDDFLSAMNGMGRVLYRSESAEDVTLRYYDLEGRLATKQELLKTFQAYLGRAKDIEEILSVEARIADLQNEIDGTGKELRYLENLVDFATISLDLYGPVAAAPRSGPTLGERIKELFSGFGGFVSTVLVVLVGVVIYGVPVLLLLFLLFWICFGKIGLVKKLWRAAAGKKNESKNKDADQTEIPAP
jgi:hypothetical protein